MRVLEHFCAERVLMAAAVPGQASCVTYECMLPIYVYSIGQLSWQLVYSRCFPASSLWTPEWYIWRKWKMAWLWSSGLEQRQQEWIQKVGEQFLGMDDVKLPSTPSSLRKIHSSFNMVWVQKPKAVMPGWWWWSNKSGILLLLKYTKALLRQCGAVVIESS